jgi:transcriptional regulator with XRE-family HTH domain
MTTAATLVRAARKSRHLTQAQLAGRAGIDQARISRSESGREAEFGTIDRLLAAAGHRLYSAPTRRGDAASAAAGIRERLHRGDRDRALRALLVLNDDLAAEKGLVRGVLGLAEPEPTGSPLWDAALAALVEWRLTEESLPLPGWIDSPTRFLPRNRLLEVDAADPVPPEADVPEAFLRHGVLAWRDTFASV